MLETKLSNPILSRSLELPCGAVLKNRFLKSAMSDSLADGEGDATEAQIRLYERWAEGGAALSLIGEVQGGPCFPEKPGNLVLGPNSNIGALRSLASRASIEGAHIWPQIGHGGALSHLPISKPKGPSALEIGSFKCDGMSIDEVKSLPDYYVNASLLAKGVGFTGVQIHCGHGFLLSQFLSPLFNRREDEYGGSIDARCRIIVEIIDEVRSAVGPTFPIGIKINSSDLLEGGLSEENALETLRILDKTSIDLIELSGGTYFPGAKSTSDGGPPTGPLFVDFAEKARSVTTIPLVATGGFMTREDAQSSLESGAVDMVGLGRGIALNPSLPNDWMSEKGGDPDFPIFDAPPPGGITAWYTMLLTAISNNEESSFPLDLDAAKSIYEERDELRCIKWRQKFAHVQS